MPKTLAAKVTLSPPAGILVRMPSFDPAPQSEVDAPVYMIEGLLRCDVTMVIGPAPNHRIQLLDQVYRFRRWVGLDHLPYLRQEGLDVGLGRFDDQLPVVFTEMPSEEVEPFVDMRYLGLLG